MKMNFAKLSALVVVAFSMINFCNGQRSGGDDMNSAPPGMAVYEAHCTACHGMKGEGDGPAGAALNPKPRNYAKDGFKYGSSLEEVKRTIQEGLDGTEMPAFDQVLTEDQITQVAEYVKQLARQEIQ